MRASLGTLGWVFLALIFLTDAEARWVSFDACGYKEVLDGAVDQYIPAPNVLGIWVHTGAVTSIYVLKMPKNGIQCVHLRLKGGYDALVVGTPESVLKKLEVK